MSRLGMGVSALALAWAATTSAQNTEKQPARGPLPSWVKRAEIPAPDPARSEAPLQILLLQGQTKFGAIAEETYFEMVMRPQTVAGLQGMSTVAIPWNVARSDLTVHAIEAIRDGKSIDLIENRPFTILRRESKLEASTLDGIRSVVLPVRGLEMGDSVRISASYRRLPSKATGSPEDLAKWDAPFSIVLLDRKIIVPAGVAVKMKFGERVPKPVVTQTAEGTEYHFTQRKAEPRKFPQFMSTGERSDEIQFSTYQNWPDVAANHVDLYRAARKTAAGSPLSLEADKIAASSQDPEKRMMLALRLVQDRVRYVAMLLGDGAYAPVGADESWDARYGDCKAKSALLLALLDRLGIQAEPMYVSSTSGDAIGDRLPSLETFDHVIVKAAIGGKSYYLDGTDYGHRVASDVDSAAFYYGLPIVAGGQLEKIPFPAAKTPTVDTLVEWDGSSTLAGAVPFKAILTLRGVNAILARQKKASATKDGEFDEHVKNYIKGIANEDLKIVGQVDDPVTGDYRFEFKGSADMGWDEYEDRKGARFPFNNDASNWNPDFERADGDFKEAPVVLNPAFWQQETEVVVLPAAKGFSVDDASPIDRKIAGSHIWRTVRREGNRVTAVTNFRHLQMEIPAAEARAAGDELEKMSENWAYLVGPKSLKPKKQD